RRLGHQGNGEGRGRRGDARGRLGQEGSGNGLSGTGAPGLGGPDDAAGGFAPRGFHQASEEGGGAHDQRRDGPGYAQRGAGDQLGHGNHHDQQNDERQRTQRVDDQ